MDPKFRKHAVVTVHGIRTYGEWQLRFQDLVCSEYPEIEFHHFRYNYFSMPAKPGRNLLIQDVRAGGTPHRSLSGQHEPAVRSESLCGERCDYPNTAT